MSDTTASLRRKIASAQGLQAVVRTMKAMAASSIGQYERSVRALADYDRTVELGLGVCLREGAVAPERVQRVGGGDRRSSGVVVFGSDQGLVGQFNQVVVERALEVLAPLPGRPRIWSVGDRARALLLDAGVAMQGRFAVPGSVEAIAPLVGRILVESERSDAPHGVSELHLVYNRPGYGAVYMPVTQKLLPLDEDWRRARADVPWPTTKLPEVMGGSTATLRALIREYLFISLFRACAESLASENASRLAAMERAERNIEDLLERLQGEFHRLRQGGIDEELFDVVAGFEALGKGRR